MVGSLDEIDLSKFYAVSLVPNRLPKRPDGKKASMKYVWRAILRGDRHGNKLRSLKIAGKRYTCDDWLTHFLVSTSETRRVESNPSPALAPPSRSGWRGGGAEAAELALADMGF